MVYCIDEWFIGRLGVGSGGLERMEEEEGCEEMNRVA